MLPTALGMKSNDKGAIGTSLAVVTMIGTTYRLARETRSSLEERFSYKAVIDENAFVWSKMMEWLNQQSNPRRVAFKSYRSGLKRHFDATGDNVLVIGKHRIKVSVETPEEKMMSSIDSDSDIRDKKIIFTSRDRAGIDALYQKLEELTKIKALEDRETYLYSPSSYGWSAKEYQKRDLESIFLREGVKETLVADLESFLANEENYKRIGAPWHRGYLLYGEPGNGKSSIVSAVAGQFRLNIYNLPLSGVKDDQELAKAITDIRDNSVLLLEDVDIFSKAMSRKQSDSGPTLAGLLNALDGVGTPHGMLVFMTTNHKEVLEPALIRSGRMDHQIELLGPDEKQIADMFRYVYGEDLGITPGEFVCMADLSNVFKSHPTDPEAARLIIKEA